MKHHLLKNLALACLGALAAKAAPAPKPMNVVVLLSDDYGWTDMGANNPQTFYETPNLDRFAAQGVRFTDGYAANPVCSPTRYSVQTGRYPTRVGLTNWLPGVRPERFQEAPLTLQMPLEETTLAEVLKARGYRTAFVGKWHLGEEEKYWPEAQGFEINVAGWSMGRPRSYFSPYQNPRLEDGPTIPEKPDAERIILGVVARKQLDLAARATTCGSTIAGPPGSCRGKAPALSCSCAAATPRTRGEPSMR